MRKYETVFISDPDLNDQARTELFDRVREIVTKENGIILDFDEWGNKKLAYEIRKKTRGHYVCLTYGGTGELVSELERNFRLSESIMKFMTIVLSGEMSAQELEAEAERIKAENDSTAEKDTAEEDAAEETPAEKKDADEDSATEEEAETAEEAPAAEAEEQDVKTEGE